jgi:hypothetical protein
MRVDSAEPWRRRKAHLSGGEAALFPTRPEVAFHLRAPKDVAQFIFRLFQNTLLFLRQIFPGAIDIEVQHRHGRLIRPRFTALAPFGGAFQRKRNLPRTPGSKHFRLQIQRVAVFGHARRPAFARFLSVHQSAKQWSKISIVLTLANQLRISSEPNGSLACTYFRTLLPHRA